VRNCLAIIRSLSGRHAALQFLKTRQDLGGACHGRAWATVPISSLEVGANTGSIEH
jgi:hypothetical protein